MRLEVTVDKRALLIAAFLFVVVGSVFVYAVTPNPGHDANTVGDGANGQVFGGTSTFAGGASSWYSFPGHLGIGQQSINPGYGAELFINGTDAWSGIGISSRGAGGDTYIDFMKNDSIKANINVKYNTGFGHERLEINAHPGAANTDTIIVTPNYFTVKGRSSTGPASPAIRLSEEGSDSDWHIIKRSSQYTVAAERDALSFSYWDGAQWFTPLMLNKTTVCIKGNCQTQAWGASGMIVAGSYDVLANCATGQKGAYEIRDSEGVLVPIDYAVVQLRPTQPVTFTGGFRTFNYPSTVSRYQSDLFPSTTGNDFFTIAQTTGGGYLIGQIDSTRAGTLNFCKVNFVGSSVIDFVAVSNRAP